MSCQITTRRAGSESYLQTETGFEVNVVTSSSPDPDVAFVSRMFAPSVGVQEDHVCGSAHAVLTPYWSTKLGKGGEEMLAIQVSERRGTLKVAWDEVENKLKLAGQAVVVMKGEIL